MTLTTASFNTTTTHRFLEVTPLGDDDWRMCDARLHPSDARRLLAYVQRDCDRVEVLWMRGKRDLEEFATIDAAFDAVMRVLSRSAVS